MKKLLLSSIIIIIGITFIGRLSYLQLFSFSPNQILDDPAIKKVYDYPERGYIYDRNGDLLVGNQPAYDVMVIPRDTKTLDTIEFCSLLGLKKEAFIAKIKTARRYSPRFTICSCSATLKRRLCASTRKDAKISRVLYSKEVLT